MRVFLRQFKALMKKNLINWMRTPCGSCFEAVFPVCLMFLLVVFRAQIEPEEFKEYSLDQLKHPLFNVAQFYPERDEWSISLESLEVFEEDNAKFMQFMDYTNQKNDTSYTPLVDFLGPLAFHPPQCYLMNEREGEKIESPVIAYIKNDNEIERDLIGMINQTFKTQEGMLEFLKLAINVTIDIDGDGVPDIGVNNSRLIDVVEDAEQTEQERTEQAIQDIEEGNIEGLLAQTLTEIDDLGEILKILPWEFMPFDTYDDFTDYLFQDGYLFDPDIKPICFGFNVMENAKNKYEVEFFFNDQNRRDRDYAAMPNQSRAATSPSAQLPDLTGYAYYSWYGYSYLHNWVANAILKRSTENYDASIVAFTVPTRMPKYFRDDFKSILTGVVPFMILLIYIPPVYRTTYRIVEEKETKVRETMKIMGLNYLAYWFSWFCYYALVNTVLSLLTVGVMTINAVVYSETILLWLMIWIYGLSLFGMIIITQALFVKARTAAIVTTVVYFGSSFVSNFIRQSETVMSAKVWASLLPTVAIDLTCINFGEFEAYGQGINWENYDDILRNYSFKTGLIQMTLAIFYLSALGLYLDLVLPKTTGKRKNPCFCFLCCCSKKSQNSIHTNANQKEYQVADPEFELKYLHRRNYEPVTEDLNQFERDGRILMVSDLKKTYDNGFQAVQGVNVKMYQDQIFVLLGHNGAGKTTTISMLTGMIGQSEGQASLYGTNLFKDMDRVRNMMGICPQHDLLFPLLTPSEHLDIFYDFKGADKSKKREELHQLINDIGIDQKRNTIASQLSGGNKRKLSVALALCGQSKFVLLDEPSAGLDLSARRAMWDMLKKHKKDRIILLTTHYMDEADILGDRIGIMAKGQMITLGSPLFLKKRFGVGYNLTLVKANKKPNTKVESYLKSKLSKDIIKLSEISREMTFQIPTKDAVLFKQFFDNFDNSLTDLELNSYGISISTLEEVFLRVTSKPELLDQDNIHDVANNQSSEEPKQHLEDCDIDDKDLESEDNRSELPSINQMRAQKSQIASQINDLENQQLEDVSQKEEQQIEKSFEQPLNKPVTTEQSAKSNRKVDNEKIQETEKIETDAVQDQIDEFSAQYSMSTAKLNKGFCAHLRALLIKRLQIDRRDRRTFCVEVIIPLLMVLGGLVLTQYEWVFDSPPRTLTIKNYPLEQRILMSEGCVSNNCQVLPDELFEQFSNKEDFDVTYVNENTFDDFQTAIFDASQKGEVLPYRYGSYQIYETNKSLQKYKFASYVNITSQDVTGHYPHFMYEAILRTATDDPEFEFKVTSKPFPVLQRIRDRREGVDAGIVSFVIAVAYAMIPASIITHVIMEKNSRLKHYQLINGMHLGAYWVSKMIFDIIKLELTGILTFSLFYGFGMEYDNMPVALILIPFALVPFTYVTSFLFTVDSGAQSATLFFHFFFMLIGVMIFFIIRLTEDLETLGDKLWYGFMAVPTVSLTQVLFLDVALEGLSQYRNITEGDGPDISAEHLDMQNIGANYLAISLHFFFWTFLLFIIEIGWCGVCQRACRKCQVRRFPKPKTDLQLDSDVTAEAERVASGEDKDFTVKVQDFRKVYSINKGCQCAKPCLAVEKLSFGVENGECFALLGVNGAGKTTTFKSLTNEIQATSGHISVQGMNIANNFQQIKKLIGYCPQHNPLFDLLSVEEHLRYYARLKGIFNRDAKILIEKVIRETGLQDHRKKPAGTLSGGNKRKLAVAISTLGNPPIILLDEPSAGMDPEACQSMWQIISKIAQRKQSAVILTTHSMQEAEALSTKMGIMVTGGIFRCFGSSQHIKSKFGTGYEIEVKIRTPDQNELASICFDLLGVKQLGDNVKINGVQEILQQKSEDNNMYSLMQEAFLNEISKGSFKDNQTINYKALINMLFTLNAILKVINKLCSEFDNVQILEQHASYCKLRVPRINKTVGFLFGLIEDNKQLFDILEYSVSQTSLEQIFQTFANLKMDEDAQTFIWNKEKQTIEKQTTKDATEVVEDI